MVSNTDNPTSAAHFTPIHEFPFSRLATKKSLLRKLAAIAVVERYACTMRGDIVEPRLVLLRFLNINGLPDCVKSRCGRRHVPMLMGCPGRQ